MGTLILANLFRRAANENLPLSAVWALAPVDLLVHSFLPLALLVKISEDECSTSNLFSSVSLCLRGAISKKRLQMAEVFPNSKSEIPNYPNSPQRFCFFTGVSVPSANGSLKNC